MAQKLKIQHYQDQAGEYRWRMVRGGRTVADSGEGYKRRSGCVKAAASLVKAISGNNYVVEA